MKVEMTEAEWIAILNLLGEFPFVKVQPLIAKLGQQLQAQKGVPSDPAPNLKSVK